MEKVISAIRQHRSKLDLTQQELANMLDVSINTVRNWERKKTSPNVHELLMLSIKLDVTLDELVNDYIK